MKSYCSWGHYPRFRQSEQQVYHAHSAYDALPDLDKPTSLLAYGQGRSYGDVCLNAGGALLDTEYLDNFIVFDKQQGILRCEAGVTLADILPVIVPAGWFLPVTPGTSFVTVGGALANDVHGKNHHRAGTFGCHVRCFELLRSDGQRIHCSPEENSELFSATIGGLGLTGLITWVEFSLKKIPGSHIRQETLRFKNLAGFFQISEASDKDWEYTVAWIDCLAKGDSIGRGLFMRGNHSVTPEQISNKKTTLLMPVNAPGLTLNRYTVKAFNSVYFNRPLKQHKTVHYEPFFYPLDRIEHWNRLYGRHGFMQYQCVIPPQHAEVAIKIILDAITASGQGSFLSVLKQFGSIPSPGMLSFPQDGTTLALDFPSRGDSTLALLNRLDDITMQYDGAVYPAKDARMSVAAFNRYFPEWQTFAQYIDPRFSSSFWRRVTQGKKP